MNDRPNEVLLKNEAENSTYRVVTISPIIAGQQPSRIQALTLGDAAWLVTSVFNNLRIRTDVTFVPPFVGGGAEKFREVYVQILRAAEEEDRPMYEGLGMAPPRRIEYKEVLPMEYHYPALQHCLRKSEAVSSFSRAIVVSCKGSPPVNNFMADLASFLGLGAVAWDAKSKGTKPTEEFVAAQPISDQVWKGTEVLEASVLEQEGPQGQRFMTLTSKGFMVLGNLWKLKLKRQYPFLICHEQIDGTVNRFSQVHPWQIPPSLDFGSWCHVGGVLFHTGEVRMPNGSREAKTRVYGVSGVRGLQMVA